MKSILKTTIIQAPLAWENIDANLNYFSDKIKVIDKAELIVLPEMFTTGFSMNAKDLAEPMEGKCMQWLAATASEKQAAICGSFIAKEKENYYNRFIFMRPDGTFEFYDKRHLFSYAQEHLSYTAGEERKIINYKGWRICPQVCYDVRFPVWSRNKQDYDLLIYVANFPQKRSRAWRSLLVARAIENQVYTIGVNRIGTDGKDIEYSGDSLIIDYDGQIVFDAKDQEIAHTERLDLLRQSNYQDRFQFLADRDQYKILK